MASKTVSVPMQTRAAAVTPTTIDKENRTAELVWSTGAAVKRMSWSGERFMEELSMDKAHIRMDRLNSGAPLLNTHSSFDLRDVIGVVERAWIDGKEGKALVRFSSRADVQPIWEDVQSGIIRNVSVGYAVHKFEVSEGSDKKLKTMRAVDWEPLEISLVPVGADAKAGVRSEVVEIECEVVERDQPETEPEQVLEVSESVERSENPEAEPQTDQAVPPAAADGADQLALLRLRVDLAAREL